MSAPVQPSGKLSALVDVPIASSGADGEHAPRPSNNTAPEITPLVEFLICSLSRYADHPDRKSARHRPLTILQAVIRVHRPLLQRPWAVLAARRVGVPASRRAIVGVQVA